ncbi:tRNA (adenosine(37)-N6)-threonylcarbamoyltransferase complex transferase subunit TsaD [Candidatus Falkowbacteria bacterium]|nr:tRNA (adenosine(37)-N6)-threonylcarbamoyltransferase complex transferase subunit TsaD [Candidatus Falkowbacteria bacterium]
MLILAIETSCDETAAAVVKYDRGCFDIKSNIIASQVEIHSKYGGIVPEVAARQHVKNIIPVVDEAMSKFKPEDIDAVAVVNGPGLITSLFVGVEAAKTLSLAWNKPLISINHLEAHIYSVLIKQENKKTIPRQSSGQGKQTFEFPALALIVSGGHTQLVLMKGHGKYEIVGETRDDAAGEAFDKVAKLLGLGYPGGPVVSAYAEKSSTSKIELPRPMIRSKDFDFSFSGLKTAVLYETRDQLKAGFANPAFKDKYIAEVCYEFQQAVIDVLTAKTIKAAKKFGAKTVILAGGVSANKELRGQMADAVKKEIPSSVFCLPSPGLSTDNAAMVGMAGVFHYLDKDFTKIEDLKVDPNLGLE